MTIEPRTHRRNRFLFAGIGALFLASFVAFSHETDADSAMVARRTWAMGTHLTVTVTARDRPAALIASESALHAVAAVEARLSTWSDGSELSRLNRATPGRAVELARGRERDPAVQLALA